ncbi:ATP-dependent endonuclease, partial [Xanthomonas citri pv. citri]
YDLALYACNRKMMLAALSELHPKISASLAKKVDAATGETEKARVLFSGMFERKNGNVQKGRFAQALAHLIAKAKAEDFIVPGYIKSAVEHACQPGPKKGEDE